MLSDSLRDFAGALVRGEVVDNDKSLILTLKAFELEARNMENRIELLTGTAHVPLDGLLLGVGPQIDIRTKGPRPERT